MISLNIRPRGRPLKNLPETLDFDLSASTAQDLYDQIAEHTRLNRNRLRITKGSDGKPVHLKRDDGKLVTIEETGLRNGSQIFVKDLGPQIAWRTVFIVEYLGPLMIHPLFFYLRPLIYTASPYNPLSYIPFNASSTTGLMPAPTTTQLILCTLCTLHFLKREYETIFVHRFSAATMPATNIAKNSAHYWILAGLNLAYYLYAPTDISASWWPAALNADLNPTVRYAAIALWVFAEVSNYLTHITLCNLRPEDGSTKRQIPKGYGFNLVTCPNYLFESLAWLAVVILGGGNLSSLIFFGVATGTMMLWAKKKEIRYRKEFGRVYRKKACMIPAIW